MRVRQAEKKSIAERARCSQSLAGIGPIGVADRECEQSGMRRHDEDKKKGR
ncbi:hypothetical protein V462_02285 [Pantoea ananatis 15320]|nr:hypothetical protein V462_02285 [Pantoea ananatis 15320]